MRIFLATCRGIPSLTESDRILAAAIAARGVEAIAAPWDEIAAERLPDDDYVCIRSTWDYFKRGGEFRRWIESFLPRPDRLWNPPGTALWNLDKIYLRELEARGVPIPATRWFEPGDLPDLPASLAETGWERAVVKPRISGGAYGTHRVDARTELSAADRALLRESGALLQEYVSEVETRGEISLMYLDGRFSHAVEKRAASGEFRVQVEFGGRFHRIEATEALRRFGEEVLRAAGRTWLYARVDVVVRETGPQLMELEILEPELFFSTAPEAAPRLAGALIARCGDSRAS